MLFELVKACSGFQAALFLKADLKRDMCQKEREKEKGSLFMWFGMTFSNLTFQRKSKYWVYLRSRLCRQATNACPTFTRLYKLCLESLEYKNYNPGREDGF